VLGAANTNVKGAVLWHWCILSLIRGNVCCRLTKERVLDLLQFIIRVFDLWLHCLRLSSGLAFFNLNRSFLSFDQFCIIFNVETARTSEEKLKFLNSVIKKLTSMPELVASAANAHAHGARAQVYFEIKDYRLAADDARRSIKLLKDLNIDVPSASFRVLVDAEEVSENFEAALEALRQWNDSNPQFATKVAKEAQRVRGKMQA